MEYNGVYFKRQNVEQNVTAIESASDQCEISVRLQKMPEIGSSFSKFNSLLQNPTFSRGLVF